MLPDLQHADVPRRVRSDRLLVKNIRLSLIAVAAAGGLAACTHVRPYERGKLAHPTMRTGNISGPGEEHMYSVQEGATGGDTAGGGGCGCN